MGTRGLTIVKLGGQVKVAQYGQWGHYPTGQGETISKFLREELDLRKFKTKLKAIKLISGEEVDRKYEEIVKLAKNFKFNLNEKFKEIYPQFHRDTGANILSLIQSGLVDSLQSYIEFLEDGLFCEYAYQLDLDEKTVTVYAGGQKYKTYSFKEFSEIGAMKKLEQELRG
jgi:hypothetical protein